MATLRTFGLARSSMEQSICEESQHLQEAMEKEKGWQRQQNSKEKHNVTGWQAKIHTVTFLLFRRAV